MNASLIIDSLGGPAKVAKLCKVTDQAVSQWRTNGIPPARLMFLQLAKPEVFEALPDRAIEQSLE